VANHSRGEVQGGLWILNFRIVPKERQAKVNKENHQIEWRVIG